ncbi:MAG: class I SAM-dependent methyltransferase [Candidatus Omnitrophota bacterium]
MHYLQCPVCSVCFADPYTPAEVKTALGETFQYQVSPHDLKRLQRKITRLRKPINKFLLQILKGYSFYSIRFEHIYKILLSPLQVCLFKNIIPFIGTGRLLDVGCNIGLSMEILQSIGWQTQGVEPRIRWFELAKGRNLKVQHGTLDTVSFPDKHFDAILFIQVFEHIWNPIETLERAKKMLVDNGRIFIEVPNQRCLSFYLFRELFYDYPDHCHCYSPRSLSLLCKKVGLMIKEIRIKSSSGQFIYFLKKKCDKLPNPWKDFLSAIICAKLFKLCFIQPLCFLLETLRFGDVMRVEIAKE